MTPRLLLAAAVLAAALPVRAEDWTEDIKPVSFWTQVKFFDETGTQRTYFARTDQVPKLAADDKDYSANAPLYMFPTVPAPTVKEADLKVDGKNVTTQVLTFSNARGTEYVVKGRLNAALKISRTDRPDTLFMGYYNDSWHADAGYFDATGIKPSEWKAVQDAEKTRRVIVLKPAGTDQAPDGPLTGDPEPGVCAYALDMLTKPASVGAYQIQAAATLAEVEFDYGAVRFRKRRWDTFMTMPIKNYEMTGSYAAPNAALPGYRIALKMDAQQVVKDGAAGAEDRLTPDESRFLRCRMITSKLDAEFLKQADLASEDAAKAKAFVKYWRPFVVDELNRMVAEGASAPALPTTPDHKKAHGEQVARAKDALDGKGAHLPKPEPKKELAKSDPPKKTGNQAPPPQKAKVNPPKPLPNAEDVFK